MDKYDFASQLYNDVNTKENINRLKEVKTLSFLDGVIKEMEILIKSSNENILFIKKAKNNRAKVKEIFKSLYSQKIMCHMMNSMVNGIDEEQ